MAQSPLGLRPAGAEANAPPAGPEGAFADSNPLAIGRFLGRPSFDGLSGRPSGHPSFDDLSERPFGPPYPVTGNRILVSGSGPWDGIRYLVVFDHCDSSQTAAWGWACPILSFDRRRCGQWTSDKPVCRIHHSSISALPARRLYDRRSRPPGDGRASANRYAASCTLLTSIDCFGHMARTTILQLERISGKLQTRPLRASRRHRRRFLRSLRVVQLRSPFLDFSRAPDSLRVRRQRPTHHRTFRTTLYLL